MRSRLVSVPVRRLIAALLLVVFPAMTTSMALPGPLDHGSSSHAGDHHGSTHGSHHSTGHRPCCDFCGAACAGSIQVRTPALPVAAALILAFAPVPVVRTTVPTSRTPHLHPLPLGPPARPV